MRNTGKTPGKPKLIYLEDVNDPSKSKARYIQFCFDGKTQLFAELGKLVYTNPFLLNISGSNITAKTANVYRKLIRELNEEFEDNPRK